MHKASPLKHDHFIQHSLQLHMVYLQFSNAGRTMFPMSDPDQKANLVEHKN